MSGGKIAAVIFFILFLVWLLLLTLGNLGIMEGSTQKYIKDRKWDKMKEMLTKLYKADGTKDTTVCSKIREWWADNQDDYDEFIADQEDGDPETLQDWSFGIPVEIEFADFIDEYFEDVGKEFAESDFLEIAKGISLCEDELDVSELKENVVRIIKDDPLPGYDPTDDCSNVTTEETILPNYVWSYDDDTFIDISGIQDTEIGSTDWRNKVKKVCKPLAMDEEYVPAGTDSSGAATPRKIKFTNVANPITGTKIEVFEEGTGGLTTNLSYTFTSSTITSFEMDIGYMNTFNKPLYTIKLDGKETDHIFAGNVGTIAFKQTKAAVEASAAVAQQGNAPAIPAVTASPAEYDYTIMQFTPNINIGSTGAKYDIILEADTFPKPDGPGLSAVHSCPSGSKTVAKIVDAAFTKDTPPVSFIQEQCYSTSPSTDYGADIDFVAAKYTAYIRKTKSSTAAATDPENPQYKFATLTRAAAISSV